MLGGVALTGNEIAEVSQRVRTLWKVSHGVDIRWMTVRCATCRESSCAYAAMAMFLMSPSTMSWLRSASGSGIWPHGEGRLSNAKSCRNCRVERKDDSHAVNSTLYALERLRQRKKTPEISYLVVVNMKPSHTTKKIHISSAAHPEMSLSCCKT